MAVYVPPLAADALAALTASDPAPAQQAVAKIIDLACDLKRYDYFRSDDPVEAAKFVVSQAVAALWESVLRHDGFAALAGRAPEQLTRWEAGYGWTRRGYGQVAQEETPLAVPLAQLLTTPDMWRTFAESYLGALEAAGRADPRRPRTVYGTFDETSYRRKERADDLAAWHEMLLDRLAGTPGDELLDRLVASPALAGPELIFLRARIAERRGDVSQAATLGHQVPEGDARPPGVSQQVSTVFPDQRLYLRMQPYFTEVAIITQVVQVAP